MDIFNVYDHNIPTGSLAKINNASTNITSPSQDVEKKKDLKNESKDLNSSSVEKNLGQEKVQTKKSITPDRREIIGKNENGIEVERIRGPKKSQSEILQKVKDLQQHHTDAKLSISKKAILKNKKMSEKMEMEKAIEKSNSDGAKEKVNVTENLNGTKMMDSQKIIKENNPSNPEIHDKLKSALNSGLVNFSDQERTALQKIIGP